MAQRTQHASTEPTINSPSKVTYDTAGGVLCPPSGVAPAFLYSRKSAPTPQTATQPDHPTHPTPIQYHIHPLALCVREPLHCETVNNITLLLLQLLQCIYYTMYYISLGSML